MKRGQIIILSGPSGSGKTTLYKKLLTDKKFRGKLVKSISVTTRPKRSGERQGRDYIFVDKKEFLRKRAKGEFLEFQKVFENYYGTPKERVESLLSRGNNVLLCIDVKGARVVMRQQPEAVSIFIKAPSWQALRTRLISRGSEESDNLRLRLKTARKELKSAKYYNYIIVNDYFSLAYARLRQIIRAEIG